MKRIVFELIFIANDLVYLFTALNLTSWEFLFFSSVGICWL